MHSSLPLTISIRRRVPFRWPKFGLAELFFSTAWFALALGIISFNNAQADHSLPLFLLSIPLVGGALGAGLGTLWHRTPQAAIAGALLASALMSLAYLNAWIQS